MPSTAMIRRCERTREAYGSGSTNESSIFVPTGPKMSAISGITPHLPSTAWMLAFVEERCSTSLPVTDQLTQLPDLRRGDPRGRRPIQTQQVRELGGIELVGLRPAALHRGDPTRVREMDLEPSRGQRIRRPVPAIGRLDRCWRTGTRLGDLGNQGRHRVLDPDTLQDLTSPSIRTITLRRRCRSIPTY